MWAIRDDDAAICHSFTVGHVVERDESDGACAWYVSDALGEAAKFVAEVVARVENALQQAQANGFNQVALAANAA